MRVPRITINADFGNDAFLGELNLLSVGYGIHQAWIYASMYSALTLFHVPSFATSQFGAELSVPYLVSNLVFALVLLLSAAFNQRLYPFFAHKKNAVIAAIIMTLGTALLFVDVANTTLSYTVMTISGILTGIGSAVLIIFWGTAFSREEPETVALNTAVSIVIAFVFYALIISNLSFPFGGILTTMLPLLELIFLLMKTPIYYEKRGAQPIFHSLTANKGKFAFRFGVPVFFFGIALGLLRQISTQTFLPASTRTTQLVVLAAAAATCLILIPVAIVFTRGNGWNRFAKPALAVVALTALFVPSALTGNSTWGAFFVFVGYLCFEVMLWNYFAEMSTTFRITPILVFGLGRGVLSLATLLGSFLPLWFDQMNNTAITGWSAIVTIACVMVGLLLLPSKKDMLNIVAPCPLLQIINSDLPFNVESVKKNDAAPVKPDALSMAAQILTEDIAEDIAEDDKVSTRTSGTPSAFSRNDTDSANRSEHRRVFHEKTERVAKIYLLSERETEILFLLAKGHKSAYIQEKLYISEGTAKTHIRHIYHKMDVHNQQELMKIVEETEV